MINALTNHKLFSGSQIRQNNKDISFGRTLTPEQWTNMRKKASQQDFIRETRLVKGGVCSVLAGCFLLLYDQITSHRPPLQSISEYFGPMQAIYMGLLGIGAIAICLTFRKPRITSL